jgi:LmbE family N-acetylglucosaminyl deacetylase
MESSTFQVTDAARRLLVAFAHPDDESFGPAGTIIHYARQGVAVHVVCATRGEAGHVDPALLDGYGSVAELRTDELLCAAQHLGLTGLHILDYHDSGMENAPENQNPACLFQAPLGEVAEKIARLIRQIRPQVVLTSDPTGGYFHPDHIKMHQATTLAFHAAGDPARYPHHLRDGLAPYQPQKLYYTAFPRRWLRLVVKILPLFGQDPAALGRNRDIDLKRMADVEQVVTTQVRVAHTIEASQRAARCYASQASHGGIRFSGFVGRWLFRFDRFTRAMPPFEAGPLERDLFAGVEAARNRPGRI